jgi:hypothetical protein
MLTKCASGWSKVEKTHNYQISFNGLFYPSFPKGEHGKGSPDIQLSHVRKLVRFFGIVARSCQEVCKRAQAAAFSSAMALVGLTRIPSA